MNHSDVEQNTDEWYSLRAGRITGSKLGAVMANYPHAFGDPAKAYAVNIALERVRSEPIPSTYKNAHMQRGHEQEPMAIAAYEAQTFYETTPGGFYYNDYIGCSPDFNVYDDGLGEVKSHMPHVHYANVKRNAIDPVYKWQILGNLKYTGRDWIDYVSYCAEYPRGNQVLIVRTYRNQCDKKFKMIDERIEKFRRLIDECEKNIRGL